MYSYGWVCPVCNRVYAPFMTTCPNCTGNIVTTAHTNIYKEGAVVKHGCTGSSGAAVNKNVAIERIDFK